MNTAMLAPLALYVFIMAITPGPNNMMLTSSGLIFGLRRSLPQLVGIPAGMTAQLVLVGAGLGAVFALEPRLQLAIKLFGSLYLFWLAWKLWQAASLPKAEVAEPITFWQAAAFQFANPKTWIMVVTAVAAYTAAGPAYVSSLLLVGIVFLLITIPCAATWASFGAVLRRLLKDERWLTLLNRIMAVLTAATGVIFWV